MRANTDWFRDAKWGVFFHYLADVASATTAVDISVDQWNRRIDAFDVEGLAQQLTEVRAGYFFITLGQNSGFLLSPNETYDSLVKRSPSHCSRRDLVADLVKALAPRGIPVMVYLPCHAPALDRQAVEGLACTPDWDASCWQLRPGNYLRAQPVDARLTEFQRHWEAVIREWSLRWGSGVRGWWFDGCYKADRMYRHPDEPNFASFAAAAKAGNGQSLVAFNDGVNTPVTCLTEYEDYTAGELSHAFPATLRASYTPPLTRFIGGAQYHVLSFLGDWWGQGNPRFCEEFVVGFTKNINAFEGVVTWDVPPTPTGRIPDDFIRQLAALRKVTR
ncbi:MAG: alpha-L-fucosidase [Phycisphaerae bacterium]